MPKTFRGALILLLKDTCNGGSAVAADDGGCGCSRSFWIAVGALTVGAAGPGKVPSSIIDPAMLAGAASSALRVVIGILIEGDGVEGMQVTEDVAAPSTMMPPREVGKVPGANRLVANG